MTWFFFKKKTKKILGVDIGTSAIKLVELSKKAGKKNLENYGEINILPFKKTSLKKFGENHFLLSSREIAEGISAIIKEAGIQTKEANFSIPDFTTLIVSFDLPPMSDREIPEAVKYEARNYIPLPLSEVSLDWLIIKEKTLENLKKKIKVLVVAIPNETINQYREIAKMSRLELKSLEAEVFALARSLISKEKNKNEIVSIVDIGAYTTTCNILDNGILKMSHSFNIAGGNFTEALVEALKISYEKAEELKRHSFSLSSGRGEKTVREILYPLIETMLKEINRVFESFRFQEGREVEKIILAGGLALLPELKECFYNTFKKEIEIANPFKNIVYPVVLEEILKEKGPLYAIAVGLALKDLEQDNL